MKKRTHTPQGGEAGGKSVVARWRGRAGMRKHYNVCGRQNRYGGKQGKAIGLHTIEREGGKPISSRTVDLAGNLY